MWQVRPGTEHNFIDGRTHVHHVHLFNSVTGGEFHVELILGCAACSVCKRPFDQSDLSTLNPKAEVDRILSTLSPNHDALMHYIQANGVPVRVGPLHSTVPEGHRLVTTGDHRFLHPQRGGK